MSSNEFLSTYGGRNKNLPQTLTLDHVSPATRLLEKRRQMFEVQEALDAQKEEALRKKDLELQESLIKFNKFLQENESKRNRAIKRAADEKKQREMKETEITKLTRQYHEKMGEEKALKEQVLKNEKYQKFLLDVIEFVQGTSEDFPEVQDLLNRYNTLRVANQDLNNRQTNHDVENEEKRMMFAQFTKERSNDVLNRNNEIATLQKNLEGHAIATLQAQSNVDSSISNMSDKVLQLGQMLASIENLLERFETQAKHMKRAKDGGLKAFGEKASGDVSGSAEDLEKEGKRAHEHLEDIATYMIDYSSIVKEWEAEIMAGTQKQENY